MAESPGDIRPIPDPTELTSRAVDKAVEVSREYTATEISHIRSFIITSIDHLRDWASIQFTLNENQRLEQKEDTKEAVKAALDAAKEAVKEQTAAAQLANNKSEVGFKEQLGQQNLTFSTALDGFGRELADVKERIGKVENLKQGGQDVIARGLAILFGIIAVITVVVLIQNQNGK